MSKHNTYRESVVRKYLTESYVHRDIPAFIRYEQTKTRDDLVSLLNEYLEDSAFLSITILDKILGNIDSIQSSLYDSSDLGLCQFFYDTIHDLRDAKYEQMEQNHWEYEVLYPLLESLNISTNEW